MVSGSYKRLCSFRLVASSVINLGVFINSDDVGFYDNVLEAVHILYLVISLAKFFMDVTRWIKNPRF